MERQSPAVEPGAPKMPGGNVGMCDVGARDRGVGIGEKWNSQPGFGQSAGRP